MLWNEAMDVLKCSYSTLARYAKKGKIRTSKYEIFGKIGKTNYWDEDVYSLVGRKLQRKAGSRSVVAYYRVNGKTKEDDAKMTEQKRLVNNYITARGARLDEEYEDRCSGARFDIDGRPAWHKLLQDVMLGNVSVLILHTSNRFARFGWEGYREWFKYYEVEVIVLYDFVDDIYYQDEQSEDLAIELHKLKMERSVPKK